LWVVAVNRRAPHPTSSSNPATWVSATWGVLLLKKIKRSETFYMEMLGVYIFASLGGIVILLACLSYENFWIFLLEIFLAFVMYYQAYLTQPKK